MKPKDISKSTQASSLPKELAREIRKHINSLSQTEARRAYSHVLRNLKHEETYHDGVPYKDALTGKELRVLEALIAKSNFEAKCLEQRFPQLRGRDSGH